MNSEQKINNFKDLKIWQKAVGLVKIIYQVSNNFPHQETYGLVSQIRRAAVSIPSNIAEGFMRRHNKEYKQFLYIALGSLAELETQIIISEGMGFITEEKHILVINNINELNKMITGLIKCL